MYSLNKKVQVLNEIKTTLRSIKLYESIINQHSDIGSQVVEFEALKGSFQDLVKKLNKSFRSYKKLVEVK